MLSNVLSLSFHIPKMDSKSGFPSFFSDFTLGIILSFGGMSKGSNSYFIFGNSDKFFV